MALATTAPAPALSADEQALVERARASLDAGRIGQLIFDMTAIRSATGEERELAEAVAEHLGSAGVAAEVQSTGERGANAVGLLEGAGSGPRLMLYAPLDTAFSGDAREDEPWLGTDPRPDFALPPRREGPKVVGLGAENPKAFAAAAVAAIEALAGAGAQLAGDVMVGLCGGSMPVAGRPGVVGTVGHGVGIRHLLDDGPKPDLAVVLKPGYAVSHEEVGYTWFRLTVAGAVNYTGIRHKGPYRDPVVIGARLVTALEAWFAEYAAANKGGLVAPQGSVNAISSGSPDRVSFIPATCEIDLDLRVAPDTTPDQVQAQLEAALERFRAADPELEVSLERTAALPGTRTDPDHWIVRSLVRAWEAREGKEHTPVGNASGASDAAIIRSAAIPTARIGLPASSTPSPYPGFSMGVADPESVQRLTEVLIHAIVDTCSRSRAQVGLA